MYGMKQHRISPAGSLAGLVIGLTIAVGAFGQDGLYPLEPVPDDGTTTAAPGMPAPAAAGSGEVCVADITLNGVVGFDDLLQLLAAWDTDEADLDGDGNTGFGDLVLLLAAWGDCPPGPLLGITLMSPTFSNSSFALDIDNVTIDSWSGANSPASTGFYRPDGRFIRPCVQPSSFFNAGGAGGRLQQWDPDGSMEWDYIYSNSQHQQHHDLVAMPNGNVLFIAWELKSQAEGIAHGRLNLNSNIWPDTIIEVQPVGASGGTIVWEWHLWDHIIQDVDPAKPNFGVVADHPELMDINAGPVVGGDWTHINSVDYHPELDQIVMSSRVLDEFYVLDHSTTTEEAAGHTGGNRGRGGDLLYRWGNPLQYDRGTSLNRHFFVVHGANWVRHGMPGDGNILAFNNGNRPGSQNDYSTATEINPPRDGDGNYVIGATAPYGPPVPFWTHGDPGDYYGGSIQCGVYRLPNGNTLITLNNSGLIFEVTTDGETVWQYDHPSAVARSPRYWVIDGQLIGP